MDTEAAIRNGTMQVTILLLVAAALAIGFGVAGVGASLPIAVGLLVLTAVLYAVRPDEDRFGSVAGVDLDGVVRRCGSRRSLRLCRCSFACRPHPARCRLRRAAWARGDGDYFLRPVYRWADLVSAVRESVGRANGR